MRTRKIKINKTMLLLSLLLSITVASVESKEIPLGKAKVYTNYRSDETTEVTMVRVGGKDSKLVLIKFNAPDNEIDGKSYVYYQNCETTRCEKIFFRRLGSENRNVISQGRYYQVLLPGVKDKISVRFDKELSEKQNARAIFDQHLKSIYRFSELNESKTKIDQSHAEFNKSCKSKSSVDLNAEKFQKSSQQSLIGMGAHYFTQLAALCNEDKLYKDIFSKISKVNFMPSAEPKDLSLSKAMTLTVYLSNDIYNPAEQAKAAIQKL